MKIVGFEANNGLRLGVVEGDAVIDLQAVDAATPTDLGEVLRREQWRSETACRSRQTRACLRPPPARRLEIRLPGRAPRQDHLPRPQLSRPRQGRPAARQRSEIPLDLLPRADVDGAASAAAHPPVRIDPARLRSRNGRDRRPARQASDHGECRQLHRRLFLRQRRFGARIPAPHHAMGHGQEFRPHRRLRAMDGLRRRAAARRQGAQDHEPAQRQHHAVRQHG